MSGLSRENLEVLKNLIASGKDRESILNFIECLEITPVDNVKIQQQNPNKKKKKSRHSRAVKKYEPATSFGYRFGEQNPHFTLTDSAKFNKAKLTQTATNAEKKFIGILKSNDIKYEFQKICYYEDKYYIVDFFIPESKIVVEIDGRYHDNSKQQADDELRTRRLIKLCGVSRVIRFTNNELDNVEKVVGKLREYLYEQD